MRLIHAALLLAVTTSPALAQREPEIVIPGRADVPVIINGVNASWSVVEGEFGLDRPGVVTPVIVFRPFLAAAPYTAAPESYFPKSFRRPTRRSRRRRRPITGVGRANRLPARSPTMRRIRCRPWWSNRNLARATTTAAVGDQASGGPQSMGRNDGP